MSISGALTINFTVQVQVSVQFTDTKVLSRERFRQHGRLHLRRSEKHFSFKEMRLQAGQQEAVRLAFGGQFMGKDL